MNTCKIVKIEKEIDQKSDLWKMNILLNFNSLILGNRFFLDLNTARATIKEKTLQFEIALEIIIKL